MLRKFSFWLTVLAAVICLMNVNGFDRDNILLYSISWPAWIFESRGDVHLVPAWFTYLTTILFWFLIGFFLDRAIARRKKKRPAS